MTEIRGIFPVSSTGTYAWVWSNALWLFSYFVHLSTEPMKCIHFRWKVIWYSHVFITHLISWHLNETLLSYAFSVDINTHTFQWVSNFGRYRWLRIINRKTIHLCCVPLDENGQWPHQSPIRVKLVLIIKILTMFDDITPRKQEPQVYFARIIKIPSVKYVHVATNVNPVKFLPSSHFFFFAGRKFSAIKMLIIRVSMFFHADYWLEWVLNELLRWNWFLIFQFSFINQAHCNLIIKRIHFSQRISWFFNVFRWWRAKKAKCN